MQPDHTANHQIITFFQDCIRYRLLHAHELILAKINQSHHFTKQCIDMLSDDEQHINSHPSFYFNAITVIHPCLIQVFPKLTPTLQQVNFNYNLQDIRTGLLNAVISQHTHLSCVSALGLCIREIVEIDSLQPWLQPFSQLLRWATGDDVGAMQAGIQFFIWLLKQTSYNNCNNELPLHKVAPLLLQNLFQIFANSQLTTTTRQKLLYLVLQLVKTFSTFDGYEDDIVRYLQGQIDNV